MASVAQGRTVNFENTIIIMTTNAGSNNKTGSVGFGGTLSDMSRERAMKATNTLYETVMALVKRRRAEGAPGDDLVCRLLRAEFEGRKLDDHEITTFARSMVAAVAGSASAHSVETLLTGEKVRS